MLKLFISFILLLVIVYSKQILKSLYFIIKNRVFVSKYDESFIDKDIQHDEIKDIEHSVFKRNKYILQELHDMKYILKYNKTIYYNLKTLLKNILVEYYKLINNHKKSNTNNLVFFKDQLESIYQQLVLSVPPKYLKRINKHINSINSFIDDKMDLIKTMSSKSPLKIHLMNYNGHKFS